MPRRLLAAAFVALALVLTGLVPSAQAAPMPSKKKWVADTYKALNGSRAYVRDRVRRAAPSSRSTWTSTTPRWRRYYDNGSRSR